MLILNLGTTFVMQILSNIANEIMKPVFMKMTSMRIVLFFVFACSWCVFTRVCRQHIALQVNRYQRFTCVQLHHLTNTVMRHRVMVLSILHVVVDVHFHSLNINIGVALLWQ